MLGGGADPIRGEMKGAGETQFFNTAKLLGSFNTLPDTADKTMGFYRRQYILEFKNSFSGLKNPIPEIPEYEYDVLCARALLRLKEIYQRKDKILLGWGNPEERREKYEKLSNPLGLFIKENMIKDYGSCFASHSFIERYQAWALENGRNLFTKRDIEVRLNNSIGMKEKRHVETLTDGSCYSNYDAIPSNKIEMYLEKKQWRVYTGYKFIENVTKVTKRQQKTTSSLLIEPTQNQVTLVTNVTNNQPIKPLSINTLIKDYIFDNDKGNGVTFDDMASKFGVDQTRKSLNHLYAYGGVIKISKDTYKLGDK